MTVKEFYENIHGDYDEILTRLPSEAFILRMIKRFPSDNTYAELIDAVQKSDISASFEASHKLKGIAANLAFSELFTASNDLSEQLRSQTEVADASLVQKITESYDTILREFNYLTDNGCVS